MTDLIGPFSDYDAHWHTFPHARTIYAAIPLSQVTSCAESSEKDTRADVHDCNDTRAVRWQLYRNLYSRDWQPLCLDLCFDDYFTSQIKREQPRFLHVQPPSL